MATYSFAHRLSTKNLVTGDLTLTVQSGNPVYIYGIHLFNPSGSAVVFTVANGAGTTLWTVDVATLGHESIEVPFLADAGLKITSSATGTYAVVMHTNEGM